MGYTLRYYASGDTLFNDPRLCDALASVLRGGSAVAVYCDRETGNFHVSFGDRDDGMVFESTSHLGTADADLQRAMRYALGVEYGIGDLNDQISGWAGKLVEVDALDIPNHYDSIRETFHTVTASPRNGQRFTILRNLRVGTEVDEEVAPMYLIRFEDGGTASAYPDEIFE